VEAVVILQAVPPSASSHMPALTQRRPAASSPGRLGDVRRDPKRCDAAIMSGIGGESGSARLALETTFMTRSGPSKHLTAPNRSARLRVPQA
jgi:hypothetical protein